MSNFISFNDFQNRTKNLSSKVPQSVQNVVQNSVQNSEILEQKPDVVEVSSSNVTQNELQQETPQESVKKEPTSQLNLQLNKAKNQNGLIEKLGDKIKSAFNFGISSKSIEKSIAENKSDDEIQTEIKNYRRSQENLAQGVSDIASCLAGLGIFYSIKQKIGLNIARINVNKDVQKQLMDEVQSVKAKGFMKGVLNFVKNNLGKILKSKYIPVVIAAIPAAIAGDIVKKYLLKLNRIGTKQYKFQKEDGMSKKEIKLGKKKAQKNKNNADLRNGLSGFINGATSAVVGALGPVGLPVYLAINSLNRYFIATREDRKEKSIKSYIQNLKHSPVEQIVPAVVIGLSSIKKMNFDSVFNKNIEKVTNQITNASLSETIQSKSAYEQLNEIMFSDKSIAEVFDMKPSKNMSSYDFLNAQIDELTNRNIIAVKFKQISQQDDPLTKALKDGCPLTRTKGEVVAKLKKAFGDKYQLVSSCAAGTVAETYVVKDSQGREYCVKMLKKGISKEKIERDTESFVKMIEGLKDKSQDEKEFLIKNARNIAQGILEEVDFNNELKAANELAKVTRQANVVKGIEVKDDLYVMEKAKGVSLERLVQYLKVKSSGKTLDEAIKKLKKEYVNIKKYNTQHNIYDETGWYSKYMLEKEKLIETLLAHEDDFRKMDTTIGKVSTEEAKKMMMRYQDVMTEQFTKIGKKGKIIHGDIHSGNIIIDMDALRGGKKNFFTLIDTGNTINLNPEQALRTLNVSKYIQNADVDNITRYVLEDAKLPKGLTKEEVIKQFSERLSEILFDDKTDIGMVTNDKLFNITDAIAKELGIIPNSTQGALDKTKKSANTSMEEFKGALYEAIGEKIDKVMEEEGNKAAKAAKSIGIMAKDMGIPKIKYPIQQKIQLWLNQFSFSLAQRAKIKRSPNAPKKNSEDYLRYAIKQFKFKFDLD